MATTIAIKVQTSLQNTKDDLHKKSKAFIRSCTALVFSPLYLHCSLLIWRGLQCFIIGPFQLISPASFHNQKDLGHKLSVWPVDYDQELLWSLSSSVKEEKTKLATIKAVLGLWLVFSHREDNATRIQQRVSWPSQPLLKRVP